MAAREGPIKAASSPTMTRGAFGPLTRLRTRLIAALPEAGAGSSIRSGAGGAHLVFESALEALVERLHVADEERFRHVCDRGRVLAVGAGTCLLMERGAAAVPYKWRRQWRCSTGGALLFCRPVRGPARRLRELAAGTDEPATQWRCQRYWNAP